MVCVVVCVWVNARCWGCDWVRVRLGICVCVWMGVGAVVCSGFVVMVRLMVRVSF